MQTASQAPLIYTGPMQILKQLLSKLAGPGHSDESFNLPVLCYHSWTINGADYEGNDHVALRADLRELTTRGYQILPIPALIRLLRGEVDNAQYSDKKLVCITFDDGKMFDYHDRESDKFGHVASFHSILQDSLDYLPQITSGPRAISFVIASPQCRDVLGGPTLQEFTDTWWEECASGNLIGIANHSWDHVHDSLDLVRQQDNIKGSFFEIRTFEDAEGQIADAHRFISEKTGGLILPIFGYPYGHVSQYLRDEFFPVHGNRIGIQAAFSTAGVPVTKDSCIWDIPRFVCGEHWRSKTDFSSLLDTLELESS